MHYGAWKGRIWLHLIAIYMKVDLFFKEYDLSGLYILYLVSKRII